MAFSNQSITPVRKLKPHIVKRSGLWRVSPYNHKALWKMGIGVRWEDAHTLARRLNVAILMEQEAASKRQRDYYATRCHCPLCAVLLSFTHRDGVSVCKCDDAMCPASERWLEPDELQEYYL